MTAHSRLDKRLFLILALCPLLLSTACGPADRPVIGASSIPASGAPPNWIIVQIQEVRINRVQELDGLGEFRLLVVTDARDSLSAKLVYPADAAIGVRKGDTVYPGTYAIAVDARMLGDDLNVYVLGLESDEMGAVPSMIFEQLAGLAASALAAVVSGGDPVVSTITGVVFSMASGAVLEWIQADDVLGEYLIELHRGNNWSAGQPHQVTTPDQGMRITYQVFLYDTEALPPSVRVQTQGSAASTPPEASQAPDVTQPTVLTIEWRERGKWCIAKDKYVVEFDVRAQGGDGDYIYYRDVERIGRAHGGGNIIYQLEYGACCAAVGTFVVESGDGQQARQEFWVAHPDCSNWTP